MTVLDKLTYAGNPENIAGLPSDRVELVVGDICDAELLDRIVPGARRHRALRRRVPQRQLHRRPGALPAHQRRGHLPPARGRPQVRRPLPPREHRRGLRRPRARRPRASFTEETPYHPQLTVQLHQGELRHARARLDPHLRPARPRSPTARTTTARTSTSRSSSRARSPTSSTAFAPSSTATGENVRDWIHTEDHSSAVWDILTKGRHGETYLIGADGERNNIDVLRAILERHGQGRRTTSTGCATAPATTAATPSTPPSCAASSAGSPSTPTSPRACRPDHRLVRGQRGRGGAPPRRPPRPSTPSRASSHFPLPQAQARPTRHYGDNRAGGPHWCLGYLQSRRSYELEQRWNSSSRSP